MTMEDLNRFFKLLVVAQPELIARNMPDLHQRLQWSKREDGVHVASLSVLDIAGFIDEIATTKDGKGPRIDEVKRFLSIYG